MYASIVFKVSRDKTAFHKLHVDELLAALGAEIFRFLIMQLNWKTLYYEYDTREYSEDAEGQD